jgi:hypothetical protein
MNGLSWLLYGADVAGNLQGTAILVVVASVIVVCILGIITGVSMSYAPDDEDKARAKWAVGKIGLAMTVAIGFAVVATFIPSRNTIMLIAASEVGETVLASAEAQQLGGEAGALATDSLRLLRKYVSEQLGETEAK